MNVNHLYKGAVFAQYEKQLAANTAEQKAQPLAGQREIEVEREGRAYTLTLSDEVKELKAALDEEMAQLFAAKTADPSDIFSYRPQDQWLVFSQYLSDNGVFDGMSMNEIEELENLLVDMTDGLDQLHIATQQGIDVKSGSKPVVKELTAAEAQIELASSITALQRFSEKFVPAEQQAGFQQLIDTYTQRNMARVMNHESINEKMNRAIAKIAERRGVDSSLSASQKQHFLMMNKLGHTTYTEAEIEQTMERYKKSFQQLQHGSQIEQMMAQLQDELTMFVTKDISKQHKDYAAASAFVKDNTAPTFAHMTNYWQKLFA